MILYHASTVRITEFYVPYGGLHVGGLHSALEAALRKVRQFDGCEELQVFVHRVEVDTGRIMKHDDMGDDHGWWLSMNSVKNECDCIEYQNKFEPDIVNSFVFWDASRIKILDVDVMSQDEAEDKLNEFYEENNLY